ncbi:SAM-dependent methyltransferase [Flavonifractor sp. An135]|nr:class I SAM-dependent methyltransferase [Flavonifractor sp. An135]OUQ17919.1 SAM-dependent methyltransferase [Flavonifractor sp. An135]
MGSYEFLAGCYDELTTDVGYRQWADYLEKHFHRTKLPVHTVLDLACGTGSLTWELARRGYEMIGVDRSEEMLAAAQEKGMEEQVDIPPLFLHQPMEKLDLYGTIDACVCCLDSVNYVTRPALLERAFERVRLFLMSGGVFIFDINTPEKLRRLDGQVFLDETEDAYCVWRAEFSQRRNICTYAMDIFQLTDSGLWERGEELHEEYAYTPEQLEDMLRRAGFTHIKRYGERVFRAPKEGEDRIFFVARKDE